MRNSKHERAVFLFGMQFSTLPVELIDTLLEIIVAEFPDGCKIFPRYFRDLIAGICAILPLNANRLRGRFFMYRPRLCAPEE